MAKSDRPEDFVESGFSEVDGLTDNASGDEGGLYAATRLYIGKGEVQIIPTDRIKNFEIHKSVFPYDAYVANGFNTDDEIVYEPAAILQVSSKYNQ